MPFSGVRNLVRGHRQEARFGPVGRVRVIPGFTERALRLGSVGDIAANALQFCRMVGVDPYEAFAPRNPARTERGFHPLIVDARAIGFERILALLKSGQRELATEQLGSRALSQNTISIVD